jgi:hypothetical protein
MAKKRNLEGTCTNHNMFLALPIDYIVDLSTCMGFDIDKCDFATFDLLKDLECARHDLFTKEQDNNLKTQTKTVGESDATKSPLPIEWVQDETPDTEDFILVLSKKKAREKKEVKISPNSLKKK